MIQIEDMDSPIEAARKIIFGTRRAKMTMSTKLGVLMATGKSPQDGEMVDEDMFSVCDLEEMAWYILTYCKYHKEGADGE